MVLEPPFKQLFLLSDLSEKPAKAWIASHNGFKFPPLELTLSFFLMLLSIVLLDVTVETAMKNSFPPIQTALR